MHKYGSWGAIAGLFIGMIYPPVGMILGSLLGAFVAEFFFAGKDAGASLVCVLLFGMDFSCTVPLWAHFPGKT